MSGDAKPELVIFDLDGTLVDSAPDIARALAVTLREAGVEPPSLDDVKRMVGDGAAVLIARALASAGVERDPQALLARFVSHYSDGVCVESRLYDGIPELLARLRTAGLPLAVVTNKPGHLARPLLDDLGIGGDFLAVVGDGDGFPRKPDPSAARALVARAGAAAARTAVIGDGLPDLRMAQALGGRPIAAAWGYVTPDRLRAAGASVVAATPGELAAALHLD